MAGLLSTIVSLHVIGNVVWIGSILAVAIVLSSTTGEPRDRGQLARDVYTRLAVPAFIVSFVGGLLRMGLDLDYYFVQTKFMHGKLFLALLVIALHHMIGARAKKVATGSKDSAGATPTLAVLLLVSAVGAVFLVVLKPF